MEFRLLGPFEVLADGMAVQLGGLKQRAVLASLVLRVNEVVSTDAIAHAVWGDDPPASAIGVVRTYVSQLRKALSAAGDEIVLANRPPGYVLEVEPEPVDAWRFEHLLGEARRQVGAGHVDVASATFREALGLWRGEVLADLAPLHYYFQPVVARLEEMRLGAIEDCIDAELELGRHAAVVGELEELTGRHPFRERLWAQLIVALYRSRRQADALAAYQAVRSTLVDQMGIEPGPELQALQRRVLSQAEDLGWRVPAGGQSAESLRHAGTNEAGDIPLPAGLAKGVNDHQVLGRAAERARLTRWFDAARVGQFGAVLIAGPPGIGKTALVTEFARDAYANGATVVLGRADEDAFLPFQALREAIHHWVASAGDDLLHRLGDEDAALLARVVPLIGDRRGRTEPPSAPVLDGGACRHLLFEAISRWVGVLAATGPAVVVLEDLHWDDRATLLAFRHLVRHPPAGGILVVATYRDTEPESGNGLAEVLASTRGDQHVTRIELSGLTDRDVADLLRSETSRELGPAGEDLAAELNRRTGGNPLFIHETLRHLSEQGALVAEDGEWAIRQPLETLGVPSGVREVIEERLRHLPSLTTAVLRQASVLGQNLDVPVLSQMTGLAEVAVIEALEPAVAAKLVEHPDRHGGRLLFSHAVGHEAILNGLSLSQRGRAHWAAGRAMASAHSAHLEPHLGQIAHHVTAGVHAGDPHVAISANVDAGQQALHALAFEDALTRFRAATDLLESAGVMSPDLAFKAWSGLATAASAAGLQPDCQRNGYLRAASIAREQEWPRRLARSAIGFATYSSAAASPSLREAGNPQDHAVADDLLSEALADLDSTMTPERCLLMAIQSVRAVVLGRAVEARELAGPLDEVVVDTSGDPTAEASALMARCWRLLGTPHAEELGRTAERVLELADSSPFRRLLQVHVLTILAVPSLQVGDRKAYETARARLAAHPETPRSTHLAACLRLWDTAIALSRGDFGQAESLAPANSGTAGWSIWDTASAMQTGIASSERGGYESLRARLVQSLSTAPDVPAVRAILAMGEAELGNATEAAGQVEALRNDLEIDRLGWGAPSTLSRLGTVAAHFDVPDLAADLFPTLSGYSGQMLVSFAGTMIDGAADRAIGQLLLALGRLDEAIDHLGAGQALEESFGADALAARTRYWHARARLDRGAAGDREMARKLQRQAQADARRLGMTPLEHQLALLAQRLA